MVLFVIAASMTTACQRVLASGVPVDIYPVTVENPNNFSNIIINLRELDQKNRLVKDITVWLRRDRYRVQAKELPLTNDDCGLMEDVGAFSNATIVLDIVRNGEVLLTYDKAIPMCRNGKWLQDKASSDPYTTVFPPLCIFPGECAADAKEVSSQGECQLASGWEMDNGCNSRRVEYVCDSLLIIKEERYAGGVLCYKWMLQTNAFIETGVFEVSPTAIYDPGDPGQFSGYASALGLIITNASDEGIFLIDNVAEGSIAAKAGMQRGMIMSPGGNLGSTNYVGIGASLEPNASNQGYQFVVIFDNSPAQEAGICSGDELISVDERSVRGLSLFEIRQLLRGEEGTDVFLVVNRGSNNIHFAVRRRQIISGSAP